MNELITTEPEYEQLKREIEALRRQITKLTQERDELRYHICPEIQAEYLRGVQYQKNIIQVTSKLEVGDRLSIFREPKNIADEMAIFIKDKDGNRLGYIPRENNQILANLMDAGKSFYGVITELTHYKSEDDEDYTPWKMIGIELYMED